MYVPSDYLFYFVQSHTLPRTETSAGHGTSLPRSVAALTDANCRDIPSQYLQKERKWDSTHLRPTPPLRPAFALIMKEVCSFPYACTYHCKT